MEEEVPEDTRFVARYPGHRDRIKYSEDPPADDSLASASSSSSCSPDLDDIHERAASMKEKMMMGGPMPGGPLVDVMDMETEFHDLDISRA